MFFLVTSSGSVHCPSAEYSNFIGGCLKTNARRFDTHTQITHESAASTRVKWKAFRFCLTYRAACSHNCSDFVCSKNSVFTWNDAYRTKEFKWNSQTGNCLRVDTWHAILRRENFEYKRVIAAKYMYDLHSGLTTCSSTNAFKTTKRTQEPTFKEIHLY